MIFFSVRVTVREP